MPTDLPPRKTSLTGSERCARALALVISTLVAALICSGGIWLLVEIWRAILSGS